MRNCIKPNKLMLGDTIGILAPSYALEPEWIAKSVQTLKDMGFSVAFSNHLFSKANGYAGSIEERAADFNDMITDDSVQMLIFGGGEVSNEILPYIDYQNIISHPKIICSYSDSITLLNAIHSQTGLVTFHGASLRTFERLSEYNKNSFLDRLMSSKTEYQRSSKWKTVHSGKCQGILTGGYLVNYAALQGLKYFHFEPQQKYLLFLEDHERFSSPAVVSKWLSNLEHRDVFSHVTGLIFGHYSLESHPLLDEILWRIGERYQIPVVRCEDYGHGENNAIFPIGIAAELDTEGDRFIFLESGVRV